MWKKIKNHAFSDLFILLQVIILLTYCMVELCSIKNTFWMNLYIRNEFGDNYSSFLHFVVNDETDPDNFLKCKEALLKTGQYDTICAYHSTIIFQNDLEDEINVLELGEGMEKIMSPKMAQGRFFEGTDYTAKERTVVIGPDIAQEYHLQLGDRLEDHGVNETGIVIGILEQGETWLFQDVLTAQSMKLDNQILQPLEKGDIRLYYLGLLTNEEEKEKAIQDAETIISKENITMSVADLEKELQEQFEEELAKNMQWIAFTIAIFVMIAAGTALIIYSRLYRQKREIGIFMALGYSHQKILLNQIGEMGALGILGYVLAVVTTWSLVGTGQEEIGQLIYLNGNSLDGKMVLLVFLVGILVLLPSLFMMIFGILRLQPRELIGGNGL